MNTEPNPMENWMPCPPGTLQQHADRLKAKRQLHELLRAAGAAVVLFCLVGLAAWSVNRWTGPQEHYFGGIACHEVRANFAAYAKGALPEELTNKIEAHLLQCPACQALMREMNHTRRRAAARGQLTGCSCPHCQMQRADGVAMNARFVTIR